VYRFGSHLVVASLSLLAAAASVSPLAAQAGTELQPGVRVRIRAPGIVGGEYTGTVLARRGDTLVLGSPTSTPVTVPMARMTSLEVSRGTSRSLGAIAGLKWGTPIGLGLGLALVPSINSCQRCNRGEAPAVVALYGISGAIDGAIIGALIGRERWERFALPAPGAAGAGGEARPLDASRDAPERRPDTPPS
jgi:hypothetical protein